MTVRFVEIGDEANVLVMFDPGEFEKSQSQLAMFFAKDSRVLVWTK